MIDPLAATAPRVHFLAKPGVCLCTFPPKFLIPNNSTTEIAEVTCLDCLRRRVGQLEVDALSGLLRRDVAQPLIERQRERFENDRIGMKWAIVFVDIDDMKALNDRSQSTGDQAVAFTGKAINLCARSTDIRSRWGSGDEYVIAFPSITDPLRVGHALGERVREMVANLSDRLVSVSFGVWTMDPTDDLIVSVDLAHAAAKAMKAAKKRASA